MSRLLAAVSVVLASVTLAACGGGDDGSGDVSVPTNAPLGASKGAKIVEEAGCLACHRIGDGGNDGPGPGLDGVGDRLSAEDLKSVLVDPNAPMPSFRQLGDEKLDQLVEFLETL